MHLNLWDGLVWQVGEGVRQAPISAHDTYKTVTWGLAIAADIRANPLRQGQSGESFSEDGGAWPYGSAGPTAGVYLGDQQASTHPMHAYMPACQCLTCFPRLMHLMCLCM